MGEPVRPTSRRVQAPASQPVRPASRPVKKAGSFEGQPKREQASPLNISIKAATWQQALTLMGVKIQGGDKKNDQDFQKEIEKKAKVNLSKGLKWDDLQKIAKAYGIKINEAFFNLLSTGGISTTGDGIVTLDDVKKFFEKVIARIAQGTGQTTEILKRYMQASSFEFVDASEAVKAFRDGVKNDKLYSGENINVNELIDSHTNPALKDVAKAVIAKILKMDVKNIDAKTTLTHDQLQTFFLTMYFLGKVGNPEKIIAEAKGKPAMTGSSAGDLVAWYTKGAVKGEVKAAAAGGTAATGTAGAGDTEITQANWKKKIQELSRRMTSGHYKAATARLIELLKYLKTQKPTFLQAGWQGAFVGLYQQFIVGTRQGQQTIPGINFKITAGDEEGKKLIENLTAVLKEAQKDKDLLAFAAKEKNEATLIKHISVIQVIAGLMKHAGVSAQDIIKFMDENIKPLQLSASSIDVESKTMLLRMIVVFKLKKIYESTTAGQSQLKGNEAIAVVREELEQLKAILGNAALWTGKEALRVLLTHELAKMKTELFIEENKDKTKTPRFTVLSGLDISAELKIIAENWMVNLAAQGNSTVRALINSKSMQIRRGGTQRTALSMANAVDAYIANKIYTDEALLNTAKEKEQKDWGNDKKNAEIAYKKVFTNDKIEGEDDTKKADKTKKKTSKAEKKGSSKSRKSAREKLRSQKNSKYTFRTGKNSLNQDVRFVINKKLYPIAKKTGNNWSWNEGVLAADKFPEKDINKLKTAAKEWGNKQKPEIELP